MKILLINPNPRGLPAAGVVISCVPLGLLYIAAALRQAGYDRINLVDARAADLGHEEILARIKSFSPEVVGISALSTNAREVHELARLVKTTDARCKVMVGGAYATSSPERIIKDPNIDFVITGEGERTVCRLVGALENGLGVSDIGGLAFKKGDVPVINPRQAEIEDIDSISFPAWDLVDMETYFRSPSPQSLDPLPASRRLIPLFTSRGCSHGCIYCHNIFGKKIRLRSVENVLREIELLLERYAPGEIEIVDDIFNFDLARAKQICDEIIKRGIKVRLSFPNGLRVDGMDEELIVKLKEAGTHLIYYAIESASPDVQKRIGKNLDLEKAQEIIRLTVRQGILTCGFFMLGFPEETEEEMLETLRFAQKMPFHFANFSYVTPWGNTPLHALYKKKCGVPDNNTTYHHHKLTVNLSSVTDTGLKRMCARAYAGFYLRPAQMRRIWKVLPDKSHIIRNLIPVLSHCIQG